MEHLPALEVLSVQCSSVEATVSSPSLVKVDISGFAGQPLAV